MEKPTTINTDWTTPEDRGKCGFCGKPENGYAKQDESGKWLAACWNCVKPEKTAPPQKREAVGTVFTEDLDLDKTEPSRGMKPGRRKRTL